ncbi:MAG: TetR/AcrR family transcriptional regulator [Actinomycetota bacterium]|nr:TetR/AcrR family transcriptional regulator [Actinomycetota bacterium]
MTAVCQRAKLTERYFYESFADLEELLVAVFERVAAEAAEVVLAASEPSEAASEARPRARAAVAAFVELMTDDPRKGRIAFVEAFASEALMRRRFETITAFASLLGDQAREFYGTGPEADRIVDLTSLVMVGGMAEALIAWLGGEIKTSRDQLIDDLTDILVATGEWAVRSGEAG